MEILIVGAGAVGLVVGTSLMAGGAQVSFWARGETLSAIRQGGVHRRGLFGDLDFAPEAIPTASDDWNDFPTGRYDYILIAAKTMANPSLSTALWEHRDLLAPGGRLMLVQNGWGNDTAYLQYFPKEQLCAARIITGCQRLAPNTSNVTVYTSPLLLGNLYGLPVEDLEPLAQAFRDGGFPCEVSEEVSKALLAKLLYNCALNPLGAVLGVCYGALTECPQSVEIMNDVIHEMFAVFDAAGLSTYWPTAEDYCKEFYEKLVPDTYGHCSSTLQDIQKKQKTEIGTLTGVILKLGAQYGVPVPANTMLYRLIKTMEANF